MLYYSVTLVKLVVIISFNANNEISYTPKYQNLVPIRPCKKVRYKMCRLTVQASHKYDAPRAVCQFEYFTTV